MISASGEEIPVGTTGMVGFPEAKLEKRCFNHVISVDDEREVFLNRSQAREYHFKVIASIYKSRSSRKEAAMEYYDSIAGGYDELHRDEQTRKLAIILKHLKPHGKLLDIGAGTGISTEPFLKVCECYAFDPSAEMLKFSKAQHNVLGVAEHLSFPDKFFDVIISLSALHHADFKKSMAEINRVAKEDAQIALTFLKKARNRPKSIQGFKKFDEERDVIFIRW